MSSASPRVPGTRPLLLIVDDEPSVLQVTSSMVRALGWRVLVCTDPEAAVELFRGRADEIDGALLDLHMPGMDGIGMLRALRGVRSDARVVVMTGDIGDWTSRLPPEGRPDGLLPKPFTLAGLREALGPIAEAA